MCKANIEVKGNAYSSVTFTVLKDLVSDVILGRDFMNLHLSVNIHFGEKKPTLYLGKLRIVKTPTTVSLFKPLSNDRRPISTKSRHYSNTDQSFISSEIQRLLKEDLIERSSSPLRAKPLVVAHENHKKRMVIDCSQTINKFTLLDTYPLPRMRDAVNSVAQYRVFLTLDLTCAYHQVELLVVDRQFTAF